MENSIRSLETTKQEHEKSISTLTARIEHDPEKETLRRRVPVLERSVKTLEAQKATFESRLAAAAAAAKPAASDDTEALTKRLAGTCQLYVFRLLLLLHASLHLFQC